MELKVFCSELNRLVSIEEVWKLKYDLGLTKKTLSFKCADPKCGARMITRCCWEYSDLEEAGFRLYQGEVHIKGCAYLAVKRKIKRDLLKSQQNQRNF